jgi:hypothetical protein
MAMNFVLSSLQAQKQIHILFLPTKVYDFNVQHSLNITPFNKNSGIYKYETLAVTLARKVFFVIKKC